ncbi:hypothetical protein [Hoeflea sp.]|uniref:hypothetical protein n=1 Tax=Hoeflea sp. TaxID=1940281 RepID=UPI003749024B
MTDTSKPTSFDRRLADIVRDVKISAADRTDVVVDMRDADRARLELLAQELQPVIDDIDPTDDRFDFGVSAGLQPRLWIDAVAHVHMGQDRRIYRFVRDTRLGRKIISDTSDMAQTADAVARYIAERVIERERILAGDFETLREAAGDVADTAEAQAHDEAGETAKAASPVADSKQGDDRGAKPPKPVSQAPQVVDTPQVADTPARSNGGFALGASWFILGCVAGAAALIVAFWDRLSALMG